MASAERFETHADHLNWVVYTLADLHARFEQFEKTSNQEKADLTAKTKELAAQIVDLLKTQDGLQEEIKSIRKWMGYTSACIQYCALRETSNILF